MVTFHPVTLEYEQAEEQVTELLAAIESSGMPAVFTMPNADTGNHVIREKIRQFVAEHADSRLVDNFGIHAYFSMMSLAAAMVGNSSSGLLEAASFQLPAVNIGTRQDGRVRARNVIDVGYNRENILHAITKAVSPEFRASLRGLVNPYGGGNASRIITDRLRTVELGDRLIRKKFYDLPIRRTMQKSGIKKATLRSDRWEVGGEFHWMGLPPAPFIPWPNAASWYLLGRHALVALLQLLPPGPRRLWVPSYFCFDVADYWRSFIEVATYSDDPRRAEPEWSTLQPEATDVVIPVNYFGVRSGVLANLARAQSVRSSGGSQPRSCLRLGAHRTRITPSHRFARHCRFPMAPFCGRLADFHCPQPVTARAQPAR